MKTGTSRRQGTVRFGRPSSGADGGFVSANDGSQLATAIGFRVATEVFGFWLLVHAGLKDERRGSSMPPSEIRWD